jgi:hypothetical protein
LPSEPGGARRRFSEEVRGIRLDILLEPKRALDAPFKKRDLVEEVDRWPTESFRFRIR